MQRRRSMPPPMAAISTTPPGRRRGSSAARSAPVPRSTSSQWPAGPGGEGRPARVALFHIMTNLADPFLMARWANAWAISRGAMTPVPRAGGLYIHVGNPDDVGRYLFARLDPEAIASLAARIDEPRLHIKIC